MQDSAETYFGIERGRFDTYVPPDEVLAAISVPVLVMAGDRSPECFGQAAGRLAQRFGIEVTRIAASHAPYHDHAPALAGVMRPFLREVSHPPA